MVPVVVCADNISSTQQKRKMVKVLAFYVHESPVVCWDCWKGLDQAEKKIHDRALVPTF
jgi:hypothetical protein